ncbi:hypothetical protein H0H92_012979, partial [Tricholoma furcatifolium]
MAKAKAKGLAPKDNKHWSYEEVSDLPESTEEPTIDTNAPRQTRRNKQLAESAPRPRPRPKTDSAPLNTDADETFIISRKRGPADPKVSDSANSGNAPPDVVPAPAPAPIPTDTEEQSPSSDPPPGAPADEDD